MEEETLRWGEESEKDKLVEIIVMEVGKNYKAIFRFVKIKTNKMYK